MVKLFCLGQVTEWLRVGLSGGARSCSAGQNSPHLKMFYVYALKSKKNDDLYVGYTEDLKQRLKAHNQGRVKSTKGSRHWTLVYYEGYKNKLDATKREKQLKEHKPKSDLKRQIKYSLQKEF